MFYQRWNNVDKHTPAQLPFPTKFQRWNNAGSSMLGQRNSIDVVSTFFCLRWNNVDKCTSAHTFIFKQISTLKRRWWTLKINVESTLHWSSTFIDVVSTLIFCWKWKLSRRTFFDVVSMLTKQHWINADKNYVDSTSITQCCFNLDIWLKMKVEPTYVYRRCFNVYKTTLKQR